MNRIGRTWVTASARGVAVFFALLWFLSSCANAADAPVPWASLTAEQLASVDPSSFHTVTESELASVPAEAFAGLTEQQAQQIDAVACNGFATSQVHFISANSFSFSSSCISRLKNEVTGALSATQLKFLPSSSFEGFSLNWHSINASALIYLSASQIASLGAVACEQMSQLQLASLNPAAFAGFSQLCMAHIQPDSFSQISSEQLSQFSLIAIGSFTPSILGAIPSRSFPGFSGVQVAALPPAAATAILPTQLAELSLDAMEHLSVEFVSRMAVNSWTALSPQQMAHFNSTAGLSASMVALIPPRAWAQVSASQIGELSSDSSTHACSGFLPHQIHAIPAKSFSGFKEKCIRALQHSALWNITADQLENFSADACLGLRWFHVTSIPIKSYSGFTSSCLSTLGSTDKYTCIVLNPLALPLVPPAAFAGFRPDCWSPALYPNITSQQISFVSLDVLASLNRPYMAEMNAVALSGLSKDQIAALQCRDGKGACGGLRADQIAHVRTSSMVGFSSECVRCTVPDAWRDITSEQLDALRPDACASFTAKQRTSVSAPTFAGYRNECIALSVPESWLGVSAQQIGKIPAQAYGGFSALHIDVMKWSRAEAGISANGLSNLQPSACSGFSSMQINNIKPEIFAKITSGCLNHLRNGSTSSLSISQVNALPLEPFSQWRGVVFLTESVFYGMDIEHVRRVHVPSLPAAVVMSLLMNHTKDVVEYWTEPLLRNTSVSVVKAIKHAVAAKELASALRDELPVNVDEATSSTWLKFALIRQPNSSLPCGGTNFSGEVLKHTPASAFFGLQPWKVVCISDFSEISPAQSSHFLSDTAIAFSASSFLALTNDSLAAIRLEVWPALPPAIFSHISATQLQIVLIPHEVNKSHEAQYAHATSFFGQLTCEQIGEIKSSQLVWLHPESQLKPFRLIRASKCPDLPPLGLVNSVPAVLPPGYTQPATSTALWIGLGITLVAVVIAVPFIIWLGKRLRAARQGEEYWPLQTNFEGEDE